MEGGFPFELEDGLLGEGAFAGFHEVVLLGELSFQRKGGRALGVVGFRIQPLFVVEEEVFGFLFGFHLINYSSVVSNFCK